MTSKPSAHLRLHVEQAEPTPELSLPALAAACRAFERATGWQLAFDCAPAAPGEVWSTSIDNGRGGSAGRLVIWPAARDGEALATPIDLVAARPLALAVAGLVGEIQRLRHALWQREAELAAGVPVAATPNDQPHLAERLEAVLQGGAEAVGCQAAGLYLLDDATSELKLRAAWGLPQERLLAPPRPLRGAVADLEALVGHAVVLEDTAILPHWRCPEDFPSAVCVPVASPSTPLGTLWLYSKSQRDFTAEETNLVEIIAGRLAADLEREMLVAAGAQAKSRDRQFESAARWLEERLPSVPPLLEDYEVAGWTRAGGEIGGSFHDWTVLPDGRLAAAVGEANAALLEGALGAAALQTALRAHTGYRHSAAQLLGRLNETLWASSPGEQPAGLCYATLEPDSGRVELALAGDGAAFVVGRHGAQVLAENSARLGANPEATFNALVRELAPGDVLLLVSSGVRQAIDAGGLRIGEKALGELVARHVRDSADGLLSRLRRMLDHTGQAELNLTALAVKRLTPRE